MQVGTNDKMSEKLVCPSCHTLLRPNQALNDGVYTSTCTQCGYEFKYRASVTPSQSVSFTLNGKSHTVNGQYELTLTLNDYIRDVAGDTSTKVMCRQGGCGCCVVMATFMDRVKGCPVSYAINSCLCPLYSCDGWSITTTRGIGNKKTGFNQIQKQIASHNGSQCGFCTPGMVMSAYSFLQERAKPNSVELENILGGNICRCTGYRAILDALQTFTGDDPCCDIEDIRGKPCESAGRNCSLLPAQSLKISKDGQDWLKPTSLPDLYNILDKNKSKKIKLVVGNTSLGFSGDDSGYQVFVDTKAIDSLFTVTLSGPVTFGANVSLAHMIEMFGNLATRENFEYCEVLKKHLQKIASTPVRNVGSWAGNMALKHSWLSFPSDVFILLETVGATLTIGSSCGQIKCSPLDFLQTDLAAKVILKVTFPPINKSWTIRTFKIMPRSQNALAYVNAGFKFQLDTKLTVIEPPTVVFGGISSSFVHAYKTESLLRNKCLSDNSTIQDALKCLKSELTAECLPGAGSAEYRENLALALFYKFVIGICGGKVSPRLQSGGLDIERPLSTGKEDYQTFKKKWPLTQPMPKISSKLQASGEAQYVPDIPAFPGQLYGAFVLSSVGNAKIKQIDSSKTKQMPGFVAFCDAGNIPEGGKNNFMPDSYAPEEIFCSGQVLYAGQAVGLVVADSRKNAEAAAAKVKVTYTEIKTPIIDLTDAIEKESFFPSPGGDTTIGDPEGAMKKAAHVISGQVIMGTQYHYTMETQSCVCVPKEDGLDVYPSTQWIDASQASVAQACGLPVKDVFVQVKRLGGAYGSKISRNFQISAACGVAAQTTNRPVKIHLDLGSNMNMVGKRFPYLAKYKVGVDTRGQLLALEVTYFSDCGCSSNDDAVSFITIYADNAYYCPNWKIHTVAVKTNTPSNTYCRSPGSTPAIYIIESIMEHVAESLGHDPTYIKQMNLYQKGQHSLTGQVLQYCNLKNMMSELLASADYNDRMQAVQQFNKANRWKKRGLSVVPMKFSIPWNGAYFSVFLSVYNTDGTVCITHGGIEVGQGINTKVIQVCAYELGIPITLVSVRPSDSLTSANSASTGGSTTSELCCEGVIQCCKILTQRLAPIKAKMKDPSWIQLIKQAFSEGINLSTQYWEYPKTPGPIQYWTYGVTCTEVELDVLTGENQISRVDLLHDTGESANPEIDIGQTQGAFVMGMGLYMLEETKYDLRTGQNLTTSTWTYHPPGAKDIPVDFRVKFLHNAPNPRGVLGSKAIGEPPLCMSCSTLFAAKHAANAARTDVGQVKHWMIDLPASVERLQGSCLPDISQYVLQE